MIKNKETELLENSSVRLTITVAEEAIRKEYDELLSEYCRNVRMDGFRKGKVPPAILLRKYGEVILGETAEKVVQKSLQQALEGGEHKPIATSVPTVDAADKLELGKEFSYKVTFDTFPKIELPEYQGLEYEELEVEVGEEDLERELKGLQEQNSVVVDKKDPVAAKGDIVNVDYVELEDGGEERTATRRQSFVFEVGSGYNLYRFDEEVAGMKAGEEKSIAKDYPADFEVKELAGRKLSLKVKLNSVKEKQLPEINDELAQDISDKYKSLEDLKKDIREKLAQHASRRVREHSISQLLDKVAAEATDRPAQVHAGKRAGGGVAALRGAPAGRRERRAARAGEGGAQQAERAGGMEAGRGEEAAPAAGGQRDGQAGEGRGHPGGAGRPGQGGRRGARHQLRAGQGDLHQEPPVPITWPSTSRTRSSTTSSCPPPSARRARR